MSLTPGSKPFMTQRANRSHLESSQFFIVELVRLDASCLLKLDTALRMVAHVWGRVGRFRALKFLGPGLGL